MDEADGTARVYEYDDLYRLTKETVTGGQSYENSFTYDAVSNRKTQTTTRGAGEGSVDAAAGEVDAGMSGARTINYSYDSRDRLTSEDATVYSWSENGNLVGKTGEATYEWDFEDRLVKVTKPDGTVVENVYDVDGVMVRTTTNGVATDLLVDTSGGLSHVVAEVDGTGTVTALYVRAQDMLLEEIRGGVAKMYEADGLGSTRSLLDTAGVQTDTWSYEAFGTTVSSTGADENPYRFAGERLVEAAGMYQNRARWLDTRTGRFVSVDPARGVEIAPITRQPYLYGNASPVDHLDPTGRQTLVEIGFVGIVSLSLAGCTSSLETSSVRRVRRPPTAQELLKDPIVNHVLTAAWWDSFYEGTDLKITEEGGWFYMDPRLGLVGWERQLDSGKKGQNWIDLDFPPIRQGDFVVADFHTHPLPVPEGREPGPSDYTHDGGGDLQKNNTHGVPGIVVTWGRDMSGPYAVPYGPERREAFLATYSYPSHWKGGAP